ncbi:MAG: hypothetical protein QXD84_07040 [Thermoplasmata archaeon]
MKAERGKEIGTKRVEEVESAIRERAGEKLKEMVVAEAEAPDVGLQPPPQAQRAPTMVWEPGLPPPRLSQSPAPSEREPPPPPPAPQSLLCKQPPTPPPLTPQSLPLVSPEAATAPHSPVPSLSPPPSSGTAVDRETAPVDKPLLKVRCSSCKSIIPIYTRERPLRIKCTGCGKEGTLR